MLLGQRRKRIAIGLSSLRIMACAAALVWVSGVVVADAQAQPVAPVDAPAHADHSGGHAVDRHALDPLSIDADLALWTFGVFLLLLLVLKKFAWGPILEGLDKREQRIADHIASAESNRAESLKLLADYETKLAKAQDEVRAIIEEGKRDAELTKQDILTTARAEAAAEMARAKREVETARDQALQELMQASANLAVDLASKIVQAKLSPADHSKLITEALAKFPASSRN